tara:strand:+ start:603 stop:1031 length:429 start_codon:yes stop_codon:yes gene_type:complete
MENKAGRPKGSRKKKMTKGEVEDLISKSLDRILTEHLSYTEYIQWIVTEYKVSKNQANEYWLRSWSVLKEKYSLEREKLITKHLRKYWEIYDLSLQKDDLSNARQVLGDISKLLGMNEPEALDIQQELKIRFKFGIDDKDEI